MSESEAEKLARHNAALELENARLVKSCDALTARLAEAEKVINRSHGSALIAETLCDHCIEYHAGKPISSEAYNARKHLRELKELSAAFLQKGQVNE